MLKLKEIALFAGLIIAGYITRFLLEEVVKSDVTYKTLVKYLVNIVYYILIPVGLAVIFLNRGLLYLDIYTVLYFSLFMITAYICFKLLKQRADLSLFFVSTFPNSVFLGFPVIYVLFGTINVAAIFGVLTVALNVLIPDIVVSKKAPLRSLLTSTAILGFVIGVLGHYSLGIIAKELYSKLNWVPSLLSYTATYTMGLRIPVKFKKIHGIVYYLAITGIFRFVLAPILVIVISMLAGIVGLNRAELVIISMMPPAVMNALIAEKYKWNSELVALIIALLTIIYLVFIFPITYYTMVSLGLNFFHDNFYFNGPSFTTSLNF